MHGRVTVISTAHISKHRRVVEVRAALDAITSLTLTLVAAAAAAAAVAVAVAAAAAAAVAELASNLTFLILGLLRQAGGASRASLRA